LAGSENLFKKNFSIPATLISLTAPNASLTDLNNNLFFSKRSSPNLLRRFLVSL
jgi:hypothetical protein